MSVFMNLKYFTDSTVNIFFICEHIENNRLLLHLARFIAEQKTYNIIEVVPLCYSVVFRK